MAAAQPNAGVIIEGLGTQHPAIGGAEVAAIWTRDTAWPTPANIQAPAGADVAGEVANLEIPGVSDLPVFDLRNGAVEDMVSWISRATLHDSVKWCPVAGLTSQEAVSGVFGYIKSYEMLLTRSRPEFIPADSVHKAAVALGVSRAVIQAMFGLGPADFIPEETVAPVLEAFRDANGVRRYRSLMRRPMIANPNYRPAVPPRGDTPGTAAVGEPMIPDPTWVDPFAANCAITDDDKLVMNTIARSAQVIIPIQGHNLIAEQHHYISQRGMASMKAFTAVENQLWKGSGPESWRLLNEDRDFYRNLLWHKAGHPVAISLKKTAATTQEMADRVNAIGIGGGAVRLPAVEPEVKALDTYAKVCSNLEVLWREAGVAFNGGAFAAAKAAIISFPYGRVRDPIDINANIRLTTRSEALRFAKGLITANEGLMATLFGFYAALVRDSEAGEVGPGANTLARAKSLTKLRDNNASAYANGEELHKDWKEMRRKNRAEGIFKPMPVAITLPRAI